MSQHDKAWWAIYRNNNRIWINVRKRRWYHSTKQRRGDALRKYYIENRNRLLTQSAENNRKRRLEILSMFGEIKCNSCGYNADYRALHIDHVNGNGYLERKTIPHAWSYKFWKTALAERRSNYQILCANCNWIKKLEKNESWNSKKTLSVR
jgi:hypothetical protein